MQIAALQAARLVGRHERVVRGWILAGKLRATRHGEHWRIETDDLLACELVSVQQQDFIRRWVAAQPEIP